MISFTLHQMRKTTAGIAMLAAVAAPYTAVPQSVPEAESTDALRTTPWERLETRQSIGSDSGDRVGQMMDTALRLEADGVHHLAIAVFEEAWHVVRATYGLYSLEQAPLLQRLIANEEARGNVTAAWDLEQELLDLARRHPDDLRTAPVLLEIAGRRVEVLDRYVFGEFPPQIVLGCYYAYHAYYAPEWRTSGRVNCRAGSRRAAIRNVFAEARRHYGEAIRIMLGHGLYLSDELRGADMALLHASHRYNNYLGGSYQLGRQSLMRLAAVDAVNSESFMTRANALIRLIDWDILYVDGVTRRSRDARYEAVLERYERAYALLEREGTPQASIDELFSPETPIVLPTFLPNPLVSSATKASTRYIDVTFVVTGHGNSDGIQIHDTTMNATGLEKDDLVRLIEDSRFRPRSSDGRFADTSPLVVRYHLTP